MVTPCFPGSAAGRARLGRMADSALGCWSAGLEGGTAYWSRALARGIRPASLAGDGVRWWKLATRRRPPGWASPNELVFETPLARLRDFSGGSRARVVPTLLLPPQAGHDSSVVDYSSEQSQVKTIRAAGLERLFSLDWVGATPATGHTGIEDYLAVLDRAADAVGPRFNLIGDCQGGWLAAIYAALRPDRVNTLTVAGGPIDFHAGDPAIGDWVRLLGDLGGMSFYRSAVALGGGVIRGELILNGFIGLKPENEVAKQLQLLARLDDPEHVERYAAFEDWYKHPQHIAGAFYLWIVEHLFRHNRLIRGELEIGGQVVDLRRISVPLSLLAGASDHITPEAQVVALAGAASTPPSRVARRKTRGGHLGLFMGREALREHWPPLLAGVLSHSRSRADRRTAERRARSRTPPPGRELPAP